MHFKDKTFDEQKYSQTISRRVATLDWKIFRLKQRVLRLHKVTGLLVRLIFSPAFLRVI